MAKRFTIDNLCGLSLSKACILFGIIDLISSFAVVVISAMSYHEKHEGIDIFIIVLSIMGIISCLLMIIGSIKNKRLLLIPHLMWELFIIGINVVLALMSIIAQLAAREIVNVIMAIIIWTIILAVSVLYWDVIFSRFMEIKKNKRTVQPDVVEME